MTIELLFALFNGLLKIEKPLSNFISIAVSITVHCSLSTIFSYFNGT